MKTERWSEEEGKNRDMRVVQCAEGEIERQAREGYEGRKLSQVGLSCKQVLDPASPENNSPQGL